MLPLAQYRAPGDPVFLGSRGEITAAVFFRKVQEMADALPAHAYAINLCDTRHGFMLGFAAALLRGQTSLLPPGKGRRDCESLLRQYPDAYLLGEPASLQACGDGNIVFDVSRFIRADTAAMRDTKAWKIPQIDCAHRAAILFTSGSTGQPAAHTKTWGQLCQGAAGLAKALDWADIPACAVVGSVSPQHMFGLEATVMLPWFAGVPVHEQNPLLPADLEVAFRQSGRPCWWMTTPLHLRAALGSRVSLAGLTGILASTMSLPVPLARAAETAWQVPVGEIYGSTETGAAAYRRTAMETHWVPLQGVSLSYAEEGEDKGNAGRRVRAAGAHIGAPVLLGDELSIEPDGRFLWLGRSDDLIKVAGKRASLSTLNRTLTDIPGVDDGVCFFPERIASNAADAHPLRRLSALYISSTLSPQAVLDALRTRVDAVFLPRPIFRVSQLPRNANGKLPAASLAEVYAACKANGLPEGLCEPASPDGLGCEAVPEDHPSIPGHFPFDPIVPGVLILAWVAEAIRRHFPHIELGALLNARFHAPLRPGENFCIRPQLQVGLVRFEVHLASPTEGSSRSGAVVVSGRWAFNSAAAADAKQGPQ